MSEPTKTWYIRALAEDVLDTVNKGYELDVSNIVSTLHSAADQIDSLNKDVYAASDEDQVRSTRFQLSS